MGLFIKQETRSYTDEEKEVLISTLPNFVGLSGNYTSAKAIENSDVFSAINIIASDIASLDLDYYISNSKQDNDGFSYLLNTRPNRYYNGYTLKFIIVANILLNGESFIELARDGRGKVTELYHVKNSQISYKQDQTTNYNLVYEISIDGKNKRRVDSNNILHFRFFSLDGIKGVSPLKALKYDLETQQSSKKFLSNFFRNGTQNGGILTYKGGKLSKEARDTIKEEWQKSNAGTNEAHKVVVLDETMEYDAIEIDTEILKLINTSNFSTEQIAKVFKIPRHKMSLETSNMKLEEMNDSYIVNTLNPYLQSLTSEMNFKLCDKNMRSKYKFNVDSFKFIDVETKTKTIKEKLTMGVIDLNEARKEFGYEEIDNEMFSKHFINLNHITLDALEEYQKGKIKNLPLKGGD